MHFDHDNEERRGRGHHGEWRGREHHRGEGRGRGRRGGETPRRARRGDVRLALLSLLAEQPNSGHGLMRAVEERSGGTWSTSPGSVYPTLAQLVDEELIEQLGEGGGRTEYRLSDAGALYVADQESEISALWARAATEPTGPAALRQSAHRLMGTVRHIAQTASPEQCDEAARQVDELDAALRTLD